HGGPVAHRLEGHLDEGLFPRLEVHHAPFQYQALRRLPRGDLADLERARAGRRLEGLEEAAVRSGLELEPPRALPADAKSRAGAPPSIDLLREALEGAVGRDGDEHRDGGRVTGRHRGAFALLRRSAWALNESSSAAQNASTSSSQPLSS